MQIWIFALILFTIALGIYGAWRQRGMVRLGWSASCLATIGGLALILIGEASAYVDENGTLQEFGFALPLGGRLLILGLGLALVLLIAMLSRYLFASFREGK